jgi:hypothetical protein
MGVGSSEAFGAFASSMGGVGAGHGEAKYRLAAGGEADVLSGGVGQGGDGEKFEAADEEKVDAVGETSL